jgi:hypothetical protein
VSRVDHSRDLAARNIPATYGAAMRRIGSLAISLALVGVVPAAALGASGHKPAAPKTGGYTIVHSPLIASAGFKVTKHGSKRSVSKFTGTWSGDAASECGSGNFTVTPALPIHLVKYNSATKLWVVGKFSRGNGDSGAKVKVKMADGTIDGAKLAVIFPTGKKAPGQANFKASGTLRFTAGSCEAPFSFEHK